MLPACFLQGRGGRLPSSRDSGQEGPAQAQAPLTLPSAIPDLPETAALTEPVQALLLDQLKDLGLDLLPQFPGVDMHQRKGMVTGTSRASEGRQSWCPVWVGTYTIGGDWKSS